MASVSAPIYRTPSVRAPLRLAGRFGAGAAVHLRTALGRQALDAALIQGADRASSSELTLRAAQLERREHRCALATALRRRLHRDQASARCEELLALAERLDGPRPATAAGIAMAGRLIGDVLPSRLCAESDPRMIGHLADSTLATMDDARVALGLGSGQLSVLLAARQ
jgi:hypothetical protein